MSKSILLNNIKNRFDLLDLETVEDYIIRKKIEIEQKRIEIGIYKKQKNIKKRWKRETLKRNKIFNSAINQNGKNIINKI